MSLTPTKLEWCNNTQPVEIEHAHLKGADILLLRMPDGSWGVVLKVDPFLGIKERSEAREIAEAFARRWEGSMS